MGVQSLKSGALNSGSCVAWREWVQILEWATGQEWFEANLRDYTRLLEAQGRMGDTEVRGPWVYLVDDP